MRAFVTGASGFIGYHVARLLLADGHQVRALARSQAAATRIAALGAQVAEGDLATGAGLEAALSGCDALFHVAAHYSLNHRDREIMYRVNVEGTKRLLQAARQAGIPRVVYTSSTACVGLNEDASPADERNFVRPEEVYSDYKKSKVLAEQAVFEACRGGMDIVIVNPSTPVGWGDIKPTPTGRIVQDTTLGRMPAYVDSGLNIVSVEDVARGHLLAYEKGKTGERYILGNENMTFGALVGRVAKLAGRPAPKVRIPLWVAWSAAIVDEFVVSPISRSAPRVPLAGVQLARHPMYFSAAKAVRELGLPQTPVDLALEAAVQWYRGQFVPQSVGEGVTSQ